jgi:hypothetical protein
MADCWAPRFGYPVTDWYRWYAWHPVETVDRGWRWLRPVWRRRIAKYPQLDGGPDFWWQTSVERFNA